MENCALYVLSLFNVDRKIAYMLRFLKTFSFISPHVYSGSPCLYCWHPPSSFRAGLICKCILQRRHTSRRVVAHTQTLRRWEALKWTQCRDIKKTHGPHLKFIAFKGYHIHFCVVWRLALCVMGLCLRWYMAVQALGVCVRNRDQIPCLLGPSGPVIGGSQQQLTPVLSGTRMESRLFSWHFFVTYGFYESIKIEKTIIQIVQGQDWRPESCITTWSYSNHHL